MDEKHVVTCFLEKDGRILILKRSSRVGTYQGRWGGVAGYIDPGKTPHEQAIQEIREETGLAEKDLELVKEGKTLEVVDENLGRKWIVHPFRFRVEGHEEIRTDWEHVETAWIEPAELVVFDTVPRLPDTWAQVADEG
ncbi:MAG: NUDIX pyrophosphatase [Chloroflexi bacterium]|nr:NUDIX pyrophosphatase [Chloroflexota bacterium]